MAANSGLFYGLKKMATDVDVQYFSHLNGLVLGNNWGDLIRLLDTCLVNGLPLTSITSASIDAQGDITLNLYAAHECMLFQIVELTGFTPGELNGKYRIKGTPTATQLILKAIHIGKTITAVGTAKLASLGYDIIFRDTNDVKRVYRAKNPSSKHPFIRVDETTSDGVNKYSENFAKYAMVGLIENMTHIDDYEDTSKLQLPLNISDFKNNWKITGTGTSVVRGWARWHWARGADVYSNPPDSTAPPSGNRYFTLSGDSNAFYLLTNELPSNSSSRKVLYGCGLFNGALADNVIPNWFLMSCLSTLNAGASYAKRVTQYATPLLTSEISSRFIIPNYSITILNSASANPILPKYTSGFNGGFNANQIPALEIPFYDHLGYLRGSLHHIFYSGNNSMPTITTPYISDASLYVSDSAGSELGGGVGGFYFYLGEIE